MSWGPAGWSMPNATDDGPGLEGRLNLTVRVMQEAGMESPRLWPTEFGYQLFYNSSGAGWAAHTHAAAVAQSLLLMRGNDAVERFFQFGASAILRSLLLSITAFHSLLRSHSSVTSSFAVSTGASDGPEMPGCSYGLFGDGMPRPALAAFAAAARFTDAPRFQTASPQAIRCL